MKDIKELENTVKHICDNLGNGSITLNYAMMLVYEFRRCVEEELKKRITIDHDLVFSGDNNQAIKVFNEMALLAISSTNIDHGETLLYVMMFHMFIAASLRDDLKAE